MPPSIPRAPSIWRSRLIEDRSSPSLRRSERRNGNAPRNLPRRVAQGAKEDGVLRQVYLCAMRKVYLLAAVVQGLAIARRGLLLNRLDLRFFSGELFRARLVGHSAVVESLAIVRRGRSSRRRRVIERLCRRPARIVIVDHSAVVQSFAVVRLRGCGNRSERHAERQHSYAHRDVLCHIFLQPRSSDGRRSGGRSESEISFVEARKYRFEAGNTRRDFINRK